jgi:hypothetical protein
MNNSLADQSVDPGRSIVLKQGALDFSPFLNPANTPKRVIRKRKGIGAAT